MVARTGLSRRSAAGAIAAGALAPGLAAFAQPPGWKPDRLEMLRSQLAAHGAIRALVMERDGAPPFAHFRADTTAATGLNVASVTKSVVSLLVGIAIDRGAIAGVDEPLAAFFPEHAQAQPLRRVTLRHLLTLSSGFDRGELDANTDYPDLARRLYAPGLVPHALGRRLVDEPGRRFYYSNLDAQLVAVILARRVQRPLADFARDELFAPLGIANAEWAIGTDGVPDGAAGLRLAPADLMRLGRLVLDEGRWQGRQVVPRDYVRAATSRQGPSDLPPRGRKELWGYGFLWWTASTPGDDLPAFYAAGYGGQFVYVVPSLRFVLVALTEQASRDVAARTAALIRDYAIAAVAR